MSRESNLDLAQECGTRYAELVNERIHGGLNDSQIVEMRDICKTVAGFDALEAVCFCQEIVSRVKDVQVASITLTIIANRVSRALEAQTTRPPP